MIKKTKIALLSLILSASIQSVSAMQSSIFEGLTETGIHKKIFKTLANSVQFGFSKKKMDIPMHEETFVGPIKDATFKRLLKNEHVRNSFLRVFLDLPVKKGILIDKNLKDDSLSVVRNIIQEKKLEAIEREVRIFDSENKKDFKNSFQSSCPESYDFLQEIAKNADHLKAYFEVRPRRAYADIICETDSHYVIVEAQNYKIDFLSERFLAYAARLYGMQLKEKQDWQDLRAVYGLVFLGETIPAWTENDQFIRHYKFLDQIGKYKIIDRVQMVEVNLNSYRGNGDEFPERRYAKQDEFLEWMKFFKNASMYDESVFDQSHCEEVKEAFREVSWKQLTPQEKEEIDQEKAKLLGISQWVKEEKEQGQLELLQQMLEEGTLSQKQFDEKVKKFKK